jgi:hypothetical protein
MEIIESVDHNAIQKSRGGDGGLSLTDLRHIPIRHWLKIRLAKETIARHLTFDLMNMDNFKQIETFVQIFSSLLFSRLHYVCCLPT